MAFPIGPYTDGQTHTENGVEYIYSGLRAAWDKKPAAAAAVNFDTMAYDDATKALQLSHSGGLVPALTADMTPLASPLVDNTDGTFTQADGVVVDTTISVPALPAVGAYDAEVVECNGLFFKWFLTPGAWVQVG